MKSRSKEFELKNSPIPQEDEQSDSRTNIKFRTVKSKINITRSKKNFVEMNKSHTKPNAQKVYSTKQPSIDVTFQVIRKKDRDLKDVTTEIQTVKATQKTNRRPKKDRRTRDFQDFNIDKYS